MRNVSKFYVKKKVHVNGIQLKHLKIGQLINIYIISTVEEKST